VSPKSHFRDEVHEERGVMSLMAMVWYVPALPKSITMRKGKGEEREEREEMRGDERR